MEDVTADRLRLAWVAGSPWREAVYGPGQRRLAIKVGLYILYQKHLHNCGHCRPPLVVDSC